MQVESQKCIDAYLQRACLSFFFLRVVSCASLGFGSERTASLLDIINATADFDPGVQEHAQNQCSVVCSRGQGRVAAGWGNSDDAISKAALPPSDLPCNRLSVFGCL